MSEAEQIEQKPPVGEFRQGQYHEARQLLRHACDRLARAVCARRNAGRYRLLSRRAEVEALRGLLAELRPEDNPQVEREV